MDRPLEIDAKVYPLLDKRNQTVIPQDQYNIAPAERYVVVRVELAFYNSEKLQQRALFLIKAASIKPVMTIFFIPVAFPINDVGLIKALMMDNVARLVQESFLQLTNPQRNNMF